MLFSKSSTYAIRAVIYIAMNMEGDKKIGVKEISEKLGIPKHYLGKLLQQLAKRDLISSFKGPGGGFYITETQVDVSILDVVESIDGPTSFENCILGLPSCSSEDPCPLHDAALKYRNKLRDYLASQKITKLATTLDQQNLRI